MLLDSQNQFREDYIQALKKGEEITLPAAYAAVYGKWAEKNKEIIYKLSAEEMSESLTRFVDKSMQETVLALLDEKKESFGGEQKRNHLKQLLVRRQLLLVSKDGGETFDEILTAEDLGRAKAMNYTIFSPTLHTETNDLQEVLDEQALLYIAKKLEAQNFTLQSASIDKDHTIHIDIVSRGGITEISVDLSQDISKPLIYNFIKEDGKVKSVNESQLPEEFGEADSDIGSIDPSKQMDLILAAQLGGQNKNQAANAANAVNAVNAVNTVRNITNAMNQVNAENALAAQEKARQAMAAPLLQAQANAAQLSELSNVMASKNVVKARVARQDKKMQRGQEIRANIEATREKDRQSWRKEQEEKQASQMTYQKKQKKQTSRRGLVGAGLAGLLGSTAVGTTLFINHINIIS